jgi:phosphoribosyl 1,2-cyclic phosphate phosphodiesterase
MRRLGEERLRTALWLRTSESLLIDCGPDIRRQLRQNGIRHFDVILITHSHGDHSIGLDELEAIRRSRPRNSWVPIPVYASEKTWDAIEPRFDDLIGRVLEKRVATAGKPLEGLRTRVLPFETIHSDSAEGSIGYVIVDEAEGGGKKLVYTSDFVGVEDCGSLLYEPEILVTEAHFFNEPAANHPRHMSFQRVLRFIQKWRPKTGVFLVHISDADPIPGDPANDSLKKTRPRDPMVNSQTGQAYEVPTCQSEWNERVGEIRKEWDLPCTITAAHDGLRVSLW